MIKIDWSNAPKDATHYLPETDEFFACWIKPGHSMRVGIQDGWKDDEDDSAKHLYIERPTEWNGEGLPPVGTVCEHKRVHEWQKVEVFAVKPNYNGSHTALFTYESGCWAGCAEPSFFRPIRTPEQIAAEELEAERQAIRDVINNALAMAGDPAIALHAHGYRKQEHNPE